MTMGLFDDIDRMSGNYQPKVSAILPGPEVLPGNAAKGLMYKFEILDAGLRLADTTPPKPVYELTCRVVDGPYAGVTLKRAQWFNNEQNLDWIGGEFLILGIDSKGWAKSPKGFSQEMQEACQAIKGRQFMGSRRDSDDGKYQNLHIVARAQASALSAPAPLFETPKNGSATPAKEVAIPF
jgi:hypothetical protein